MYTLADLRNTLKDYLDDPRSVGFSTVKLDLLINEALRWLINEAIIRDYFFRKKEYAVTTTIGTATYALPLDVGHVISIERIYTDGRVRGTIIDIRHRNDCSADIREPVVYENFDPIAKVKTLNFARVNYPLDSYSLNVIYAPHVVLLTAPTDIVVDIDQNYMNLLLLRATVQGYGGEKKVDAFWMNQFNSAWESAIELIQSRPKSGPRYVRHVD